MRQSLKVAISLLVSILFFAGFTVFAFSGLFNILEARFYLPRVQQGYLQQLNILASRIEKFHEVNFERFSAVVRRDFVASTFASTVPPQTLLQWRETIAALKIVGVRLLSVDGKKIMFSSLSSDRKESKEPKNESIAYKNYDEADQSIPGDQLMVSAGEAGRIIVNGEGARFIYSLPVSETAAGAASQYRGTALFYVSAIDLLNDLQLMPQVPVTSVTLVNREGVLLNFETANPGAVAQALQALWGSTAGRQPFTGPLTLARDGGKPEGFVAFSSRLGKGGVVSLVVSNTVFEMSDLMKGLLLGTFFLTVFLLAFLLLNLRSDPLEVLRQRVKRFQIQLIGELVDSPGGADWGKWRREMETRKDEITWQIQRGIGRVSRKQKPVIDEYLSKSWNEIIDLFVRRADTTPAPLQSSIDISRLESLIQAALQNASFIVPEHRISSPAGGKAGEI